MSDSQLVTELIDELIRSGIKDLRVLEAIRHVPRKTFVPRYSQNQAYVNRALPIECGQTISQPYIVSLMAEALQLKGTENVLEVGTGSGYAAAILAELSSQVFSIERHPELAASAEERLNELNYRNVSIRCGDGSCGWPEAAPFDAISIAAVCQEPPPDLIAQLTIGGRMVLPIGRTDEVQELILIEKFSSELKRQTLCRVRFVPLVAD